MSAVTSSAVVPSVSRDDGLRPWRWTRADVIRLAELGFFQGQRVLLIDGEIFPMPPMNRDYANGILYTLQAVQAAFGPNFTVRPQLPLDLGQSTDLEPDIAVVAGPIRSHPDTPTTAVLIVEIADSSLNFDLGKKASLYAAAGIADYWVLDVVHQRLYVFRNPKPDNSAAFQFSYSQSVFLDSTESIAPLVVPACPIRVADLLP